jgi:ATP-dependent DNA helicase RecG
LFFVTLYNLFTYWRSGSSTGGRVLENQTIEWKETWRDDYMRTICAFANTSGGALEIGRRDDGKVIGVANTAKLLEDLPNKIKNAMAIIADVEIRASDGERYIVITVGAYPFPISYHGVYYIRSGSTTQELTGNALDEFILRKQGKTWDGVPVPYLKVNDFESDAFKVFRRKAIESTRLKKQDLEITDEKLLDTLQLTESNYIKRAAALLFHQDPEIWVPGSYVKIGMFENDADLLYQHEVHCPLIMMQDRVMETVYLNYFKGIISYEGIQRVETYPVPHEAFREAITNAIVHRDYSTGIPIQIKVFPDRVIIYNDGRLPENWSVQDLLTTHRSEPHNPMIANAFFRAGMIESWGRGIEKITKTCINEGKREPAIEFRKNREFSVTFYSDVNIITGVTSNGVSKDTVKDTVKDTQQKILVLLSENPHLTAKAISAELGINERNVKKNIKTLKDTGLIERVGPDRTGYWVVRSPE